MNVKVNNMIKYLLCVLYVIFSVSGLTLVKMGSNQNISGNFMLPVIEMYISKMTLTGLIFYGMSFCLYMGVISKFDLGIIIPILGGIVNIAILGVSYFVLKEHLSLNMVIGAMIITIGIVIMNIKR